MQLNDFQNKLLAVLFAAGEPLEASRMAEALGLSLSETHGLCAGIGDLLDGEASPLELRRLGDSYQLCARAEYAPVIRQVLRDFGGAIISISHDRKYIEEVCETVYELTEDGLHKVTKDN